VILSVDPSLVAIVRPGFLAFDGVTVTGLDARLDGPLAEAERRVREHPPAERDGVRAMYRRVGLDPTRRRPSSEALLRRVVRGEPLPRINVLVDVCNWCSLELQLPYGLYDLDHVDGDVVLRLGGPGEQYAGIRKDAVHVEGRLALADALGAFGNPSSDSARTMVTTATTRALAVVYAPRDAARRLPAVLDVTAGRLTHFSGGRERDRQVLTV